MRKFAIVFWLLFYLSVVAVSQQNHPPSTPEERQRFVTIARKLEQSPLDPSLKKDREWGLLWLIQVPDISVNICTAALGNFYDEKSKYSAEMTAQLTFSSGAFVIEHTDQANDQLAQYMAGVEGALNAYKAILRAQPEAKSKELDRMLAKQAQGELSDFVKESTQKHCK